MKQRGTFSIQRLALVGMMAAMVFALTYVGIDIPTGLGKTKIHFGNIMCLLSAFLLGPVGGGLAAGVGSALFDLMDSGAVRLAELQHPVSGEKCAGIPVCEGLYLAGDPGGGAGHQGAGNAVQRRGGGDLCGAFVYRTDPRTEKSPCIACLNIENMSRSAFALRDMFYFSARMRFRPYRCRKKPASSRTMVPPPISPTVRRGSCCSSSSRTWPWVGAWKTR